MDLEDQIELQEQKVLEQARTWAGRQLERKYYDMELFRESSILIHLESLRQKPCCSEEEEE